METANVNPFDLLDQSTGLEDRNTRRVAVDIMPVLAVVVVCRMRGNEPVIGRSHSVQTTRAESPRQEIPDNRDIARTVLDQRIYAFRSNRKNRHVIRF